MAKHMVIPDPQAKPGHTFEHMSWAGQYAVDKQPDVIICIGDFPKDYYNKLKRLMVILMADYQVVGLYLLIIII